MTQEEVRLEESRSRRRDWKRWGPYLSERAWGTVREDYSAGTGLLHLRDVERIVFARGTCEVFPTDDGKTPHFSVCAHAAAGTSTVRMAAFFPRGVELGEWSALSLHQSRQAGPGEVPAI